ncbi:platelet endothelial cell adhesion molecule-like isoform X2 [Leucoraja erinacea]|uniref:platelet endothelial cell adhesion molecule-like isoform X2 n=1 Tax=Leucoraja erinaceus TaxID=7782 RepID=UPI00245597CD|nr:platelet endothelial cell adhesion molecule-like isoform X2 [Leucoraja erinacea]
MSKTTILFFTQLLCGIGHVQTDVMIRKTEIKSDSEASAQVGSSITLTCSVSIVATSDLQQQITYSLYKGSQKNVLLNTSMTPEDKYSFTIQSARATHTGYYVCVVNVGDKTATSEKLYIEVTGQIQRPRLTIQPMKVIVGNQIDLRCDAAEEIPPLDFTFYKYKNGKPSPAGQKASNTNFVTNTLKVEETTNYSCKVKGSSLATISIDSEPVTITVQDPFTSHLFTIEPQPRIFEGDDFTMRCTVQMSSLIPSSTKAELTITKGTTSIANSVTGEAKISKKATADDTGQYTCHAVWKETLKILVKQVTVAVPVSKPSLNSTAFNSIVVQGDRLNLTCAVVRGSWPIIYTFYKGTPENFLHQSILNATAGVYTIPSADTADSGEYFCQAENNAGVKHRSERSQNININVKVPVSEPKVHLLTSRTTLEIGKRISIQCHSTNGSSPVTYSLFLNQRFIHSVKNCTTEPAVFNILINNTKDGGVYKCKAENEILNSSKYSEGINFTILGTKSMWLEYFLPPILLILFLLLCYYIYVKCKKKKRRKIVKQQNQGSVKENTVAVYSKVKEKAHPRLGAKDSYALMEGTDSECDCETNYVNIVRKTAATNMDSSTNEDDVTYTELNLASPKKKNVPLQEGTLYARINLQQQ